MTNGLLLRVLAWARKGFRSRRHPLAGVMAKVAARANDKSCPFRGEKPGSCFTQTAARPRDDDDFPPMCIHYLFRLAILSDSALTAISGSDGHAN